MPFVLKDKTNYFIFSPLYGLDYDDPSQNGYLTDYLNELNKISKFLSKENPQLAIAINDLGQQASNIIKDYFVETKQNLLLPFKTTNDANKATKFDQDPPFEVYKKIIEYQKAKKNIIKNLNNHFTDLKEQDFLFKPIDYATQCLWEKSNDQRKKNLLELRSSYYYVTTDPFSMLNQKLLNFLLDNYPTIEKININNQNQFFETKMYAVFDTINNGFWDFQTNLKPLNEARTFSSPQKAQEWIKKHQKSAYRNKVLVVCEIEGKITNPNYFNSQHSNPVIKEMESLLTKEKIETNLSSSNKNPALKAKQKI